MTHPRHGLIHWTACYVSYCPFHTNNLYEPKPLKYVSYCKFCEKYGHQEEDCTLYQQHLHEMNQKAAEMNLSIKQKPTCGFCKKKGHNKQQCHQKLEAEYRIMNAIKPKPKEQVVSMTNDETTAQDTDTGMDTETSGKLLPDPLEEDSSATTDTQSN